MGRKDKPISDDKQLNPIGAFLRHQRQLHSLSLTAMAKLTGYAKSYLSAVENGNIRASRNVITEYKRHLKFTLEQLPSTRQNSRVTTNSDALQDRPWNVPYQRNPLFMGRGAILERLHDRLSSSRKPSHCLAITGLGGIGKTQLAIEYAYTYRADYKGVFWVRGDSSEVLSADFMSLPITTGLLTELPDNANNPGSTYPFTKKWLRQHAPCLLIIDNLDDPQDFATLTRIITQLGDTRIVITTRLQTLGQLAQTCELGKLSPAESALFLLRRINVLPADGSIDGANASQQTLAYELAENIDGLPLALDQAGSYIEETGCDLGHYLRLFKQQSARMLNERGGFALGHPEPIATTWSLAFKNLQQCNTVARDLLYLCAFLYPDAIDRELFQQGASALGPALRDTLCDPVTLDQAISELRKYSFLQRTGQANTLAIHRLVQSVIRASLDEHTQLIWAERAVRIVNAIFPRITALTWLQSRTTCRQYFAHAQAVLALAERWQMAFPEVAQLASKVGTYQEDISEFEEAEKCYQQAIELSEYLEGITPDELTSNYTHLATLYERQERYRQAEDNYKKVMSTRQSEITAAQFTPAILEALRSYTTFLMRFEQRKSEASRLCASAPEHFQGNSRHSTIDDDHPDIRYKGQWSIRNDQHRRSLKDYGGNTHYTDEPGASFQYAFVGSGIAILADTSTAQGIIDIYLDDHYVLRKNTEQDTEHQPQTIIYHHERLDNGSHTLTGELVSGTFALDALVIFTRDTAPSKV
jgi:Uncharacterized protein conserved in bacteria